MKGRQQISSANTKSTSRRAAKVSSSPRKAARKSGAARNGDGIHGRLQLERNGVSFLGPARVDLLEAIREHGSITQAAKAVGLSYKAAWDAVDAMNNVAADALVSRSAGGMRGGGTTLTEYGTHVVDLVRGIEREYAEVLEVLDDPNSAFAAYKRLHHALSMQTSARNQWIGTITRVTKRSIRTQVELAIAERVLIRADVSTQSAERLGLAAGNDIGALVKATSVKLELAIADAASTGQSNRITATVLQVKRGDGQLEVTARIAGERTITAVLTGGAKTDSVAKRSKVIASFGPESVLLVRVG